MEQRMPMWWGNATSRIPVKCRVRRRAFKLRLLRYSAVFTVHSTMESTLPGRRNAEKRITQSIIRYETILLLFYA